MQTPKTIDIDYTAFVTFLRCPKAYALRFLEHWAPRYESPSIVYGRLIHLYLSIGHQCGTPILDDVLPALYDKAVSLLPPNSELPKSLDYTQNLLHQYFTTTTLPQYASWSEHGFIFPLSKRVNWQGRIDIIYKADEVGPQFNGHPVIVEHKTASKRGPTQHYSLQYLGYAYFVHHWLGAIPYVVLNHIVLTSQPQFYHEPHLYTASQLDEWRDYVLYHINRLKRTRRFWENRSACTSLYPCIFRDICRLPQDAQEAALKEQFIRREWQPFAKDELMAAFVNLAVERQKKKRR